MNAGVLLTMVRDAPDGGFISIVNSLFAPRVSSGGMVIFSLACSFGSSRLSVSTLRIHDRTIVTFSECCRMIFRISDLSDLKKLTITKIIDHISLEDFLQEKSVMKNILLCPTNAIDIEKKKISDKCIDCGVCWANNRHKIMKDMKTPNYEAFKSYIVKEKMFIYKWLGLILSDYSGINIKSTGFSRTKRIPFIVKRENVLYIFKSIRDIADIENGTITLSNFGVTGISAGFPIIRNSEACIIGLGAIKNKLEMIDNKIQNRFIVNLVVSFDHRIVDGIYVCNFINKIKQLLENNEV